MIRGAAHQNMVRPGGVVDRRHPNYWGGIQFIKRTFDCIGIRPVRLNCRLKIEMRLDTGIGIELTNQ